MAEPDKLMLSGRFDNGEKERVIRGVASRLQPRIEENLLIVSASTGGDFGPMTQRCLSKMTKMAAFCFEDYGQKTGSKYCSYYEVKYAYENDKRMIPLKLYEGPWPPAPKGDEAGTDQNKMVFNQSMVYKQFSAPFDEAKLDVIADFLAGELNSATFVGQQSALPLIQSQSEPVELQSGLPLIQSHSEPVELQSTVTSSSNTTLPNVNGIDMDNIHASPVTGSGTGTGTGTGATYPVAMSTEVAFLTRHKLKEAQAQDVSINSPSKELAALSARKLITPSGTLHEGHVQDLIAKKLADPTMDLTEQQSIELLSGCMRRGGAGAKVVQDKDVVIVIGNTGAGKSTFVNYLAGCKMAMRKAEGLGVTSLSGKVLVVVGEADGGPMNEIMPIGHAKKSETFVPQVEMVEALAPLACVDCPGFLDNRGPEINIANAVNNRVTIAKARSVRIVVLINYDSLKAERGRGLSEMLHICSDLLGSEKELARHKGAILIGVSKCPLVDGDGDPIDHSNLKKWLVDGSLPVMKELGDRVFTFHPREKGDEECGFWSRSKCIREIHQLDPIQQPSRIFKTVLTDSDDIALQRITNAMAAGVLAKLKVGDFQLAGAAVCALEQLRVIEHATVEKLLSECRFRLQDHFRRMENQCKDDCSFERFEQAGRCIAELEEALSAFYGAAGGATTIDMKKLQQHLRDVKQRAEARKKREQEQQEALDLANRQIQEHARQMELQKDQIEMLVQMQEKQVEQLNAASAQVEQQKQEMLQQQLQRQTEQQQHQQEQVERQKEHEQELQRLRDGMQKEMDEKITAKAKQLEEASGEQRGKLEAEMASLRAEQETRHEQNLQQQAEQRQLYEKQQQEQQQLQQQQELEYERKLTQLETQQQQKDQQRQEAEDKLRKTQQDLEDQKKAAAAAAVKAKQDTDKREKEKARREAEQQQQQQRTQWWLGYTKEHGGAGPSFTKSGPDITISGPDKATATKTGGGWSLATADDVKVDSDSGGRVYCEVVLESGRSSDGGMDAFFVGPVRSGLHHDGEHLLGDDTWFMHMYDGSLLGNGERGSNKKGGLKVGDRIGVAVQDGAAIWYRNGKEYNRHPRKVTGTVVLGVQMHYVGQKCRLITNPTLPESL